MMPQSFVQTIPDMLNGVEIRTVSGAVINEINVICPKKIYSVSSCMIGEKWRCWRCYGTEE